MTVTGGDAHVPANFGSVENNLTKDWINSIKITKVHSQEAEAYVLKLTMVVHRQS